MRFVTSIALLVACSAPARQLDPPTPPSPPVPVVAPPMMTLVQSGIVPEWMDKTVDPCVDFFAYSCGTFVKTAVIPPDRSGWSAILIVVKQAEELLKKTLEDAAAASNPDPDTAKLGNYFAACNDEQAIEGRGTAPVAPLLAIAASANDPKSTAAAITQLHANGIFPFFDIAPQQDFGDATKVIAGLDQDGLGLPDREYYLTAVGSMPKTRAVYAKHVERMFVLAGQSAKLAAASADSVLHIETALAKLAQDKVSRRDPHKIYNRVDRAGLETKIAPTFPWRDYLSGIGIPNVTEINVNSPAYFTGMAKVLRTEKPAAIRAYLAWHVLRSSAGELTRAFLDEQLALVTELRGVTQLPPRWRKCVNQTDRDLGELLGQSYVKQRFAGDSKARAAELTTAISGSMRTTIDSLPWMDAATRSAANAKLGKMASLVGYPETWRSYPFEVKRDDFFGNVRTAARSEMARRLAKIGKPVDRLEWQMTPPTVNAYYDPSLNEIALPAGQLQPPFFAANFHAAVNFGATGGSTIGHEITHGFDDEGSQFDGDGNLRNWWSPATKEKFAAATRCVVDQYAQYEAVPNVKLDGELTAGENIADIGGVKLGYQGYVAWRAAQTRKPPAKVDGYTDDQLYFLSYGQSWCDKQTDQALETAAHSNPHSPAKWRVNGVIVNQPGFAPAFGCKAGSPMAPAKTCSVW